MADAGTWITVATSFGAAVIGGSVVLVGGLIERRAAARAARQSAKGAAYAELLTSSAMLAHAADTARLMIEMRSGIAEGVAVAAGIRSPLDPMTFHDWLRPDLTRLHGAWTGVCAHGSQDAIREANGVVAAVMDLFAAATQPDPGRVTLARWFQGEKFAPAQRDAIQRAQVALAEARRRFGELTRAETGVEPADLFLQPRPAIEE